MISDERDTPEDDIDDGEDDKDFSETIVIEAGDNVGGMSVEVNVEELVADIEQAKDPGKDGAAARRRLEALLEEKRLNRLLDEDDDFGIDDLDAS